MSSDALSHRARFGALAQAIPHLRSTLRWVSYAEAERLCEQLAAQLIADLGRDELRRCHFQAIPRGGLIVLGMLSYALDLSRAQLHPHPEPSGTPLVLVDDCALSGARLRQTIRQTTAHPLVVAPLVSHPSLRAAILAQEPRVQACVSGADLHDFAPDRYPDPAELATWRSRWAAQSPPDVYWLGLTEHVVFAWNEPDLLVHNPELNQAEQGWYFLPPDRCLKTRMRLTAALGELALSGQRGNLRPAPHVAHGDFDDHLLLINLLHETCLVLEGVAADIWRALIATGDQNSSADLLAQLYEVEAHQVRADIDRLVATWDTAQLLTRENADRPSSDADLSTLWPHAGQQLPPSRALPAHA